MAVKLEILINRSAGQPLEERAQDYAGTRKVSLDEIRKFDKAYKELTLPPT